MIFLNLRRKIGIFRPHGILSYQSILKLKPIHPIFDRSIHESSGLSWGLGPCSYDVRVAQRVKVEPGGSYLLSTIESFNLPDDICGTVMDKSTWARKFFVFQNTHIDPGFWGDSLTIEATMHGNETFIIEAGTPIAQVKFEWLDQPTSYPYKGRYQGQSSKPQMAIFKK